MDIHRHYRGKVEDFLRENLSVGDNDEKIRADIGVRKVWEEFFVDIFGLEYWNIILLCCQFDG